MKFTNVKQLIIKFMGGGLINFPTRFLRWVKINGDSDGSDGGGGDDGGSSEFSNKEFGDSAVRTYFDKNNISYDNVDYWPDLYIDTMTNEILNSYVDFVSCGLQNIDYLYKNAPYNLQDSDFDENNSYSGSVGENDKIYIGNSRGPAIAKVGNIITIYKVQINSETYYALYTNTPK